MRTRTLPDRIADELIARVFTGELRPGDRLPPDRALAAELGVDRTSLRNALRQLTRMNLLRPVRGSGVTVLDYREHAGLDFLAAVLEIPGLELGGAFLLEALDHWEQAMPPIVAAALGRITPAQIGAIDALLENQARELERGAALDEVARLEVALIDSVVAMLGDVTLRLMANSTRPLRQRLTRLQLELTDDPLAQIQAHRMLMKRALEERPSTDVIRTAHAQILSVVHAPLRAHLRSLPTRPHRTTRWQRHESAGART